MGLKLKQNWVLTKTVNQESERQVFDNSIIPFNAWKGDVELEEVVVGFSITRICPGAFQDCTSLTTVTFNGRLKYIDPKAFAGCTALQRIVLPDTLDVVECSLDTRGVAKMTLSRPSSEMLIENLKRGYPMEFYYKDEHRDDHWD